MSRRYTFRTVLGIISMLVVFTPGDKAQPARRRLIIEPIDETKLVTLAGNTRPEATPENDLGPVEGSLHLDMWLLLKRSPDQEEAARKFVESLTDTASPNFHHWLTAKEYGERFGASPEDIQTASIWLQSYGFTINDVPAHNMVIDFSGTAEQAEQAFHTQIHYLNVGGRRHFANMSDPRIPSALLPGVTGIVSLHNFMPKPQPQPEPGYFVGRGQNAIVPGDIQTIYNISPIYSAGWTGRGQTIVVLEDSDTYTGTGDWSAFREEFGLTPTYRFGTLRIVHPGPGAGGACTDPGVTGDDFEAALDVEWASAAAPDAAIVLASCANTTHFGGSVALQNMLTNGGPIPQIVSISYIESETEEGAANNSYINSLYQLGAAEGVSIFVGAGDEGGAASDYGAEVAAHGISVNGRASTPYNVAVGGTDFSDVANGTTSIYWNTINGTYFNSAKSYVPEIPWNGSCASAVLAKYLGYKTSYGPAGLCNAGGGFLVVRSGSGGPSGCATGAPAIGGVVSGTCVGYPKPSWQSVYGNPADGVRDLPDVSLFASGGPWGHYYVLCISDPDNGGVPCVGSPSTWAGGYGTSFASPIMAGIQALINQAAIATTGVGNPNPYYYSIAAADYSSSTQLTLCNSTTGSSSTCAFNDITQGDIEVPCTTLVSSTYNCYLDGVLIGVLSTSNSSYQPAYAAAPGWDFATGLGSVNALNLLTRFVALLPPRRVPFTVAALQGLAIHSPAPRFSSGCSESFHALAR